jgi:hypothetical protein
LHSLLLKQVVLGSSTIEPAAGNFVRIMHQHSGFADVELVLLLDLQIIHAMGARLQADRLSARRIFRSCKLFWQKVLWRNRALRERHQCPIARPSIVYIRGEFVVWQLDSNQTASAAARPGALRMWTEGPAIRHAQP